MLPTTVVRGRKNPRYLGLASRLKRARKAVRLSFASVAEAAGLTEGNTVWRLEQKSGHIPRLDTVERIAYALGLAPAFLAYGIEGECPESAALFSAGIGDRLRSARTAHGLSALALAQRAKTSHTTVGKIERGGTVPTVATAEALATVLNVSPGWLAFGTAPRGLPVRHQGSRAAESSVPGG